jgi:hypothetical protein
MLENRYVTERGIVIDRSQLNWSREKLGDEGDDDELLTIHSLLTT